MDPGNLRECLRELELDEAEGADWVMVKPGLPYADVIRFVREHTSLPVAAYHVSGEYSMLRAAARGMPKTAWCRRRCAPSAPSAATSS